MALPAEAPLGRQGEALSRQHLRRTVPLLLRIPGKHAAISHHSTDRQVQRRRSRCRLNGVVTCQLQVHAADTLLILNHGLELALESKNYISIFS